MKTLGKDLNTLHEDKDKDEEHDVRPEELSELLAFLSLNQ